MLSMRDVWEMVAQKSRLFVAASPFFNDALVASARVALQYNTNLPTPPLGI